MNILSIGNSFSNNATRYLHDMAKGAGVDIVTENLVIGGCSLERHMNNFNAEAAEYQHELNGESTGTYVSIQEMLKKDRWDVITLQQASHFSIDFSTYNPYLEFLSAGVKQYCPNSTQVIHQTWAYGEKSERLCNELGFATSEDMFFALKDAYNKAAALIGAEQIPCGLAFYLAQKEGFESLYCDDFFHANEPYGKYLLAAVWLEFFSGKNASESSFIAEGMTKDEKAFLDRIAHEAILNKDK